MAASRKVVWTGRVISILVALVFVLSALMKVKGGAMVTEGMAHLGLRESMRLPLAVIEFSCAVISLIPATSVLGAILLTGYLGGAVASQLRVGHSFFETVFPIIVGVLVWGGLRLRDGRLRALIPFCR